MASVLEYSALNLASTQNLGPFALSITEDGGVISDARLQVGFEYRSMEKIAKSLPFVQVVNISDRIDFNAATAYNCVTALALEELLGIDLPDRANHIRLLLLELNSILSHLFFFSNVARSVGQFSIMNHCLREREKFSDIFEMYCGSRLGFGAICLGGVRENATDGWCFRIEKALGALDIFMKDLRSTLLDHPFFNERVTGLLPISASEAAAWNLTGANAIASGHDCYKKGLLEQFGYEKKLTSAQATNKGDVRSRVERRFAEIYSSIETVQKIFHKIPEGNYRIRVGLDVESRKGVIYKNIQGPRGDIGIFISALGGTTLNHIRYFTPSSMVVRVLPQLLKGIQIDDLFLAIQSLDISFSEVDK